MNYVDSKLPMVTKSFTNKLFNKVMKKCFGIGFFNLYVPSKNPWHV